MPRTTLLLLEETADRVRVAPATLRYWRHIGYGPPSARLGRRVVYRESDVEKWLDEQYAKNPDKAG